MQEKTNQKAIKPTISIVRTESLCEGWLIQWHGKWREITKVHRMRGGNTFSISVKGFTFSANENTTQRVFKQ